MRNSKTWIRWSLVMMSVLVAKSDQADAAAPRGPNFNDDAYEDIAIGVPTDDDFASDAGSFNVLYGSATGPDTPNMVQLQWSQAGTVPGSPQSGDRFGSSLAWGDFDGDGCDDLAAGVPYENDGVTDAGAFNVFMTSADGFDADDSELWTWDTLTGFTGSAHDHLGEALASGDFDGDGVDDLAIGLPGYNDFGIVYVIGGEQNDGLGTIPNETLAEFNTDGRFGSALATGDFNCDGFDDLAVGEPHASDIAADAGAVKVYYGGGDVLFDHDDDEVWTQNSTAGFSVIDGVAQAGDWFGFALVTGNFDSDSSGGFSCDDLAIGSPYEVVSGVAAGSVNVLYGGPSGLNTSQNDDLLYNGSFLPGSAEQGAAGYALTVGEFNSDGYDDLAIGAPLAPDGATTLAGAVYLVKGGSNGLTSSGVARINQTTQDVAGSSQSGDLWGQALGYARARGATNDPVLVVGAPNENSGTGAATTLVMDSDVANFDVVSSVAWFQHHIEGTLGSDHFGWAFAQVRSKATTTCD